MAKKIGIVGSGQVAQTLAAGFIKHGFEVMAGSRDQSKLEKMKQKAGADLKTGSFSDAANFGDIVVMTVKGMVAEKLARELAKSLSGKTVIDTMNPIADAPPENGVLKYFTDLNTSLMEILQRAAPEASFVKAFSCVGNARMVNPVYKEGRPTMFICGNSDKAKAEVISILELFGWEVSDLGVAAAARAIEPLCMLWCIPGFKQNEWSHAYKVLH